jgi:tetratricopeptide (TPR) repeat protein
MILAMHYWKARELSKSLETLNGVLSAETPQSVGPVLILHALNWRGNTLERMGDHRRALKDYRQGLLLADSIAAAHPDDLEARLDKHILTGLSALEEARLRNPRVALKRLNEALIGIEQLYTSNPESFYQRILAVGYSFRGEILSSLGDQAAARTNLSRSLSIAEDLAKTAPTDLDSPLQMARAHAALGVLWAKSSRFADARKELSTSFTLAKRLLASRPADGEMLNLAGVVEGELSVLAGCQDERPCAPATHFPLPSLIE